MDISESLIVSVSFSAEDSGVLIVGKQKDGKVDVINAFQGKEAWDLYKKITTVKLEENDKWFSTGSSYGEETIKIDVEKI